MQDLKMLNNKYPYNQEWYDQRYINRKVISAIHEFCKQHDLEKFYAKGSLIYGCMLEGSDIDHVRIKTRQNLSLDKKMNLINDLEKHLSSTGIRRIERIREDKYIRVFNQWNELENIPNAFTKEHEIYPHPKLLSGKNEEEWYYNIIKTGLSYTKKCPPSWIQKIRERIIGKMRYDVFNEYVNIDNYSPFWYINNCSTRQHPFYLPFISSEEMLHPIHPDTFFDMGLKKEIKKKILVYPTSSCRTVYHPETHQCYKLSLTRQITRKKRILSKEDLRRSEFCSKILEDLKIKNFSILPEKCFYYEDERYNYIIRDMPKREVYPLFYIIKTQNFSKNFMYELIKNIIKSWMEVASHDLYLEYHTQNILVDINAKIYHKDLDSASSFKYKKILQYPTITNKGDLLSLVFDRTVCNQNLDHIFRYDTKLGDNLKKKVKQLIKEEIKKYDLDFPSYSLDFSHETCQKKITKNEITSWRVPDQ